MAQAEQGKLQMPTPKPKPSPKAKPAQADPLRDAHYSVLAYKEAFLNRTLADREARSHGIALAAIGRRRKLEPGKAEHPIWEQINTHPRSTC